MLQNPHVITKEHVFVGVVTRGPDGKSLNSRFDNRSTEGYQNSLGNAIGTPSYIAHVCTCVCVYVRTYLSCIHVRMCIRTCVCMYMCVCVCVHMCEGVCARMSLPIS